MNFKKFISGVSALTIAASAFAGMAVTANADGTPLTKIDDDYTTMSASDLATEAAKYSLTASDTTYTKVNAVEGSGIQFYTYLRKDFTAYADRTLETTYDGKDIIIAGTWYTGDTAPTIGAGSRIYLAFLDSVGNEVFKLHANRNDGLYGYSVGGGAEVKVGSLNSNAGSADMAFNAVFDTVENKIESLTINGTTKETNVSVSATDLKTVRMGRVYAATDPKSRQTTNATLKALNIQEVPVETGTAVNGEDTLLAGSNGTYTTYVTDQYGDSITSSKAVTLALQEAVTGVSLENGVLSADASVASGTTVTLVATADGLAAGTKVVTITADKGYELTTTPYALVSVDGGAAINSGFDGVVDFATSDYTGANHTVVISKPGYTTRTENLTLALNETGTYKLDCSVGSYYEDFSQVNDNMNQTDVAIGNGSFYYEGGTDTSATVTLPESVNADGSVITVAVSSSHSRNGYLYLGDALGIYLRVGGIRESSQSVDSARVASGYDIVKMYLPNTDNDAHRPVLYVNGIKNSATLARKADSKKVFNSITVTNAGNTPRVSIDYILVEPLGAAADTEPTSTVTIVDGESSTATSYYKGTSFTLPAAAGKDGYTFDGWSDGTNTYAAGTALTADATKTYTAVYEEIVAPTSKFVAADWTSTVADWAADGNKLTDKYNKSVYGYKTEITGNNGYSYTVKGDIKSAESDGSTTLTLGTITNASPMVFYLITDEALDLTNSRVYGVAVAE